MGSWNAAVIESLHEVRRPSPFRSTIRTPRSNHECVLKSHPNRAAGNSKAMLRPQLLNLLPSDVVRRYAISTQPIAATRSLNPSWFRSTNTGAPSYAPSKNAEGAEGGKKRPLDAG